jgi:hypothetical protein
MNTEDLGVKKAPTPTASPSCGTCKPRWGLSLRGSTERQ